MESTSFNEPIRRIGGFEAVRRHPIVAVLPLLLLVAAAVAYGLTREPVYEAESRQAVGRIDTNQPGALAGFAAATEALASTYARGIDATSVVNSVAKRSGLSETNVRSALSATPVPDSPVFKVTATGDSPRQAVDLANDAAAALRAYVADINAENPNSARLFKRFEDVSFTAAQRKSDLNRLKDDLGANPTLSDQQEINRARAKLEAAELDVSVARRNYGLTQQSQGNAELIQTLSAARTATTDRWTRLQIALFAAIAAGGLLGVALAMLRANRAVRRAYAVA